MSHQEMATLEYASACKEMLDEANNRIDKITQAMASLAESSTLLMDEDTHTMLSSLISSANHIKKDITSRKSRIGNTEYSQAIKETRDFLSIVNTVVLKANSLNSAISEALDEALASGKNGMIQSKIAKVEEQDLRRMMNLLSRNPAHSNLSFEDLKALAESKLDPSKKVKRNLIADIECDVREAMTTEKISSETINEVVGQSPEISPLELMDSATSEIIDERLRRSAVKAIVGCITSRGFIVRKENIRHIKETDTVKISAMKPNGQKAEFSIDLNGKFIYHFQGYEGRACEKDIGPIESDLERIYGISLTDRKTIWVNPDKNNAQHHKEMKARRA